MIRTAFIDHQCACCKGEIPAGEQYVRLRVLVGRRRRIKRFHMQCGPAPKEDAKPKGIDRDALVSLYKQHRNISQVSEILGIAFNTTKYHLQRAGVEIVRAVPRKRSKPQIVATPWTGLAKKACYRPTISGRVFQQDQP